MRRTTRRLMAAGVVLLWLAACGGGGDDNGNIPPPPSGSVDVGGTVRFERVPFQAVAGGGLDYAHPVLQPARGVVVRALDAGTQAVLATGTTSENGLYSLAVPDDTSIVVQVVARLQQGSAQSAPRWDVRVQNGLAATTQFTHTTAPFDSSGGQRDIDIPTGISASGAVTGTRASGPFAILDTIYTAIQALRTVEPDAALPTLLVDWGSQTIGTYFASDGTRQWIALNWKLNEDTEEFDQHVIAHEFGHFLEHNFSRSDSGGGDHALGDRLDPRVAFSEGFGYAFAAFALDDPLLRDSFVNNGSQVDVFSSVESNPAGASACWCSESSVWSMLWDLHDPVNDGADAVAVGFQPVWAAMKGAHRDTDAVTSIFSFITALKAIRPQETAAINALVAAQNIDATQIDDFATGETHAPYADAVPLFTDVSIGSPVVLRSVDNGGRHNKLGNHRFLRFTPPSSRTVTVAVATSNPATDSDPDFAVYRRGVPVAIGEDFPGTETESFAVSGGQTYVIDAYDCANGCSTAQGTPGDYDLTVSIQ